MGYVGRGSITDLRRSTAHLPVNRSCAVLTGDRRLSVPTRRRKRHIPVKALTQNRRRFSISEDRPETEDSLSLAQQIEINLAEPRQDHRVVKLARCRIAGA